MAKALPPHKAEEIAKALAEARQLLAQSRYGALAYLEPNTAQPAIGRIAIALIGGKLITLISDLSAHTKGLTANPVGALMLGEIGKGDGLASPRLSLTITAWPVEKQPALTDAFLSLHPKAQLYANFADFRLWQFAIQRGAYYGGFGRAHDFDGTEIL